MVVGGTSGVGLATAQLLAKSGNEVVISGRSKTTVDQAIQTIGGSAQGFTLDFTVQDSFGAFVECVGAFDHLALVGSGKAAWGAFKDLKLKDIQTAFDQKFLAFFACVQEALKYLRKDGSVVFVTGGASRSAIPGTAGVAAVDGAIQAMAITLAKELAPLRVNVVSPGLVDTPVYDYMSPEKKAEFFKQMGGNLPVGRIGQPNEVAAPIQFLISNPYTTGALLDIDGGGRLH